MSQNKIPLNPIEEMGLLLHDLGHQIGKPNQAVDMFRAAIKWGQMTKKQQMWHVEAMLSRNLPVGPSIRARLAELYEIQLKEALEEKTRYAVAVQKDNDSCYFCVIVPDLPGCFAVGDNIRMALENAKEAIKVHVETSLLNNVQLNEPKSIDSYIDSPEYIGDVWTYVTI